MSQSESVPGAEKLSNRRRNGIDRWVVDKSFQFRLIGLLSAIYVSNSLFFSIVLYYFYEGHINRFYVLVPRKDMIPLVSSPTLFSLAIGFIVVFGLVMVAILGLYLSNHIAGPLYRVKMSLNRVSEGDVNFEVRFRDRDFLEDFPGYFNNMLRALREQSSEDINVLKAIENQIDDPNKIKTLLRSLREKKETQIGLLLEEDDTTPAVH